MSQTGVGERIEQEEFEMKQVSHSTLWLSLTCVTQQKVLLLQFTQFTL